MVSKISERILKDHGRMMFCMCFSIFIIIYSVLVFFFHVKIPNQIQRILILLMPKLVKVLSQFFKIFNICIYAYMYIRTQVYQDICFKHPKHFTRSTYYRISIVDCLNQFNVWRIIFWGNIYGITLSVCPSVCPSVYNWYLLSVTRQIYWTTLFSILFAFFALNEWQNMLYLRYYQRWQR